ncbi:MAG: hypothetical protein HKN47_22040 [Pirellulaceae bacterium]|nr:hypothetical protein [Pirellulaceae bacterium]
MKRLLTASFCVLLLSHVLVADEPVQRVEVGKPAPEITVIGIDGKEFRLSDAAKRGKNVALMFNRAHW